MVIPKVKKPHAVIVQGRDHLAQVLSSLPVKSAAIAKANADECKEITGFSIGGVPPVAHVHSPSRIFIDEKLNRFDMVYAAAGHPYVVFGITFDNLHLITKGEINSIVE